MAEMWRLTNLFLVFLVLSPFVAASDFKRGEILILPFASDPHSFHKFATLLKTYPDLESDLYGLRDEGISDVVYLNVVEGKSGSPSEFMTAHDDVGRTACGGFDSKLISVEEKNGYQSVFWETTCKHNETTIKSLQIAIYGRKNIYHVLRQWRYQLIQKEYMDWVELLSEVYLCDTRKKKHPCPEDFLKIK